MTGSARAVAPGAAPAYDLERVRADFPALHQSVRGHPLVYLDNAASAQKPLAVIDAITGYYRRDHANVHRGVHALSERATAAYEGARAKLREFVNARSTGEIVFVRGTTEAINLVAFSCARARLAAGDEVLITALEHHSNIVPWQLICAQTGARLRVAPISDAGEVLLDEYEGLLSGRTRIVAITHISNALGTINPVRAMVDRAHAAGALVLVDGAQAAPHMRVDVQDLDCDFYALSGHKMYGPTGIGVLYGRAELLDSMPPWQGGGEMIREVTFERSTWADIPHKFEAGTPNIADAVGLGAAVDYLQGIGHDAITAHEQAVLEYALARSAEVPGMRVVGTAQHKAGILSFTLKGIHPHDIGTVVDHEGVAIRAGHHCAMPLMRRLGLAATARASFGLYNGRADVDALFAAIRRCTEMFA